MTQMTKRPSLALASGFGQFLTPQPIGQNPVWILEFSGFRHSTVYYDHKLLITVDI